jgi:hypothetical protein
MAVTENDIVQNAAAIASLINTGSANVNITDLDAVTSLSDSDLFHVSVSSVDKKITRANTISIIAGQGFIEGNAYVAENIFWLRASKAFTVSKVRIGAVTAPTGSTLIVDVNYHATDPTSASTIFTTQANRPAIAISAYTADSGTPDVTSIADGGWLGISIDQIGSTITGADINIEIIGA